MEEGEGLRRVAHTLNTAGAVILEATAGSCRRAQLQGSLRPSASKAGAHMDLNLRFW